MSFVYTCPLCTEPHESQQHFEGLQVHCHRCGQPFTVLSSQDLAPEPDEKRVSGLSLVLERNDYAVSLLEHGRAAEAEKVWQQALALLPEHPLVTCNLALLHWRRGDIDDMEALRRVERSCLACPNDPEATLACACIHMERGDFAAAMQLLAPLRGKGLPILERVIAMVEEHLPRARRRLVLQPQAAEAIAFAPDPNWLYCGIYWSAPGIWVRESNGSLRTQLYSLMNTSHEKLSHMVVAASGRILAVLDDRRPLRIEQQSSMDKARIEFSYMTAGPITCIDLLRDGSRALLGQRRESHEDAARIQVLNVETMELGRLLKLPGVDDFDDIALASNGPTAAACAHGRLACWDLTSTEPSPLFVVKLPPEQGDAVAVGFGHDESCVVVAFSDMSLLAFSTSDGAATAIPQAFSCRSPRCIFTSNGDFALFQNQEHIRVLETRLQRVLFSVRLSSGRCTAIALSNDDLQAAVVTDEDNLELWAMHLRPAPCRAPWLVSSLNLQPRAATLRAPSQATGSPQDTHEVVAAAEQAEQLLKKKQERQAVRQLQSVRDCAGADKERVLRLWEQAGRNLPRTGVHEVSIVLERIYVNVPLGALALKADCHQFLMNSRGSTASLRHADTGREYDKLKAHEAPVTSVRFNLSGSRAITGGMDLKAFVWDTLDAAQLAMLGPFPDVVADAWLSCDGKQALILTAGLLTPVEDQLCLWDVERNLRIRAYGPFPSPLSAVALGRYDDCAAIGDMDGVLRLINLADGATLLEQQAHEGMVTAVSLDTGAPQNLLSAGEDGCMSILHLESLTSRKLACNDQPLAGAVLSADAKWAALGTQGGVVELWDVRTGEHIYRHEGDGTPVVSLAMCLDRYRLMAGYESGLGRSWRIVFDVDASEPE